jgi:hypothetical protein
VVFGRGRGIGTDDSCGEGAAVSGAGSSARGAGAKLIQRWLIGSEAAGMAVRAVGVNCPGGGPNAPG